MGFEELKNKLKDKRVLILGFGREGKDNLKFLRKLFPEKVIGIADQKQFPISLDAKRTPRKVAFRFPNIKWHLGENYLKAIKKYDIILKSPGVPLKIIKPNLTKKQKVSSQTEIFLENCPGKIVGVTGTKGKSTTASLIYKILKEGGLKVHLVGNIGKPVLNLLFSAKPSDVYVYELSSHQLQTVKKSPQIAVFLNIYPEHGDYYRNFNEYLKAKQNIYRWQKKEDYFIYNSRNKYIRETAKLGNGKKITLNSIRLKGLLRLSDIHLKGKFNLQNIKAAIAVGNIFGISQQRIEKAIKNFKGLPHRLEYVGTFKGIQFYNDSLATIPEATIEAIESLGKNLQVIILGGFERGQNFKKLAKRILDSNIEIMILFPDTGKRIWQQINKICREVFPTDEKKVPKHFFVEDMREAVKLCYQYTKKGGICLLSPSSASFNLFEDYAQRGNLFKKYINKFAKK